MQLEELAWDNVSLKIALSSFEKYFSVAHRGCLYGLANLRFFFFFFFFF